MISFNPFDWLFGKAKDALHETTPQATGNGQAFESVKTTTVIGYVLAAGVTIYLARKVLGK